MREALAFAKQHGPMALIAIVLVWIVAYRAEGAHKEILDAARSAGVINDQLRRSVRELVYLERIQCLNQAKSSTALQACARGPEE